MFDIVITGSPYLFGHLFVFFALAVVMLAWRDAALGDRNYELAGFLKVMAKILAQLASFIVTFLLMWLFGITFIP